jgi:hypothetical protein
MTLKVDGGSAAEGQAMCRAWNAASVVAALVLALIAAGCGRVRFELLAVDGGPSDGALEAGAPDAARGDAFDPDGCVDGGCPDGLTPTCVDPSSYPGGGVYFASFSAPPSLALNGGATVVGDVLRLPGSSSVGTAFLQQPFTLTAGASVFVHFAFRIHGGGGTNGGDGMTFALQSAADGATAVGTGGGGFGYKEIAPSVAVELDTFENPEDASGNEIGLLADGVVNPELTVVFPPFTLNDGVLRYLWFDYDGATGMVEVYVADTPARPTTPLLTYDNDLDLFEKLGSQAYLGWTAATGSYANDHDVHAPAWLVVTPLPKCR